MRETLADVKGGGRVVRGSVSSSGGIVSGVGFSVVKNSTGNYTVTFLSPFKSTPALDCQNTDNNTTVNTPQVSAKSASAFTVIWKQGSGLSDASFDFIAMEANPA